MITTVSIYYSIQRNQKSISTILSSKNQTGEINTYSLFQTTDTKLNNDLFVDPINITNMEKSNMEKFYETLEVFFIFSITSLEPKEIVTFSKDLVTYYDHINSVYKIKIQKTLEKTHHESLTYLSQHLMALLEKIQQNIDQNRDNSLTNNYCVTIDNKSLEIFLNIFLNIFYYYITENILNQLKIQVEKNDQLVQNIEKFLKIKLI